jgi:hypothetical protein
MIVVRHSVVIDEPVERAGFLWADFVAHRIADPDFVPDEWIEVDDNACGVMGTGDVAFEALSVARTKVTLSVRLDRQPSDPETGREVEATYRRAVNHLDRFHDYADARVG